MKKQLLLLLGFALSISIASAQQKIKDGTVTGTNLPNTNALLELESANKGLLNSRVALRLTTDFFPLTAHVAGMMVYNTATAGDVTPGIYFNDGTKWIKAQTGTISLASGANTTLTGTGTVADPFKINTGKSTIDQSLTTGVITHTNEVGDVKTVKVLSTNPGNLLTVGTDGGAILNALSLPVVEPFNLANTLATKATENTQNIYQNGNIGIGDFSTSSPIAKLDVRGAVRSGTPSAAIIGTNSIGLGTNVEASGDNSFASGIYSKATGSQSIAMGGYTAVKTNIASGVGSIAIGGGGNTATGIAAFSTGQNNTVAGTTSFNTGEDNIISAGHAFNTGQNNKVSGSHAASFGSYNQVSGVFGGVFGYNNISSAVGEFVIGSSNAITTGTPGAEVSTDALFQVANGGFLTGVRGNAITVLKNGNTGIGISGVEAAAKPTERLDVGTGNVKIRDINTNLGATSDKIVVADASGILKTVARSSFDADLRLVSGRSHITQDAGTGSNGTTAGTGNDNVAIGNSTLNSVVDANATIAIGTNALRALQGGAYNTALGRNSLIALTNGTGNAGIGWNSLGALTTGLHNTAIGVQALELNTNGNYNIAIGFKAGGGVGATTGSNNLFLGNQAGLNFAGNNRLVIDNTNTGSATPLIDGDFSTKILTINNTLKVADLVNTSVINPATDRTVIADATGTLKAVSLTALNANDWSILGNTGTSPLVNYLGTTDAQPLRFKVNSQFAGYVGLTSYPGTGPQDMNVTLGYRAGGDVLGRMVASSDFRKNTAIGYEAMANGSVVAGSHTTENTAIGYAAGSSLGGASTRNTFVGGTAGVSMSNGSRNVAIGQAALFNATQGEYNLAIGWSAGANAILLGNNNTFLGTQSGYANTGSNNVFLGFNSGIAYTGSNRLMIDNSGTNTPLIDGDFTGRILTVNNTLKVADLATGAAVTTGNRPVVANASGQLMIGSATSGAVFQNIRKTTNTVETIAVDDYTVISRATAASTFALPDPATNKGRILVIVNHSDGTITLDKQIFRDNNYATPGSPVAPGSVNTIQNTFSSFNTVTVGVRMTIQSTGDEWTLIGI